MLLEENGWSFIRVPLPDFGFVASREHVLPRAPLLENEMQGRVALRSGNGRQEIQDSFHLRVDQVSVDHDETLCGHEGGSPLQFAQHGAQDQVDAVSEVVAGPVEERAD